jgi:hypothetical protein
MREGVFRDVRTAPDILSGFDLVEDGMKSLIQLEPDEALVLFELLSSGKLVPHVDSAEGHVFGVVLARLEEQLVAPFASDYEDQLAVARSSLVERYGEL